MSGRTRVMAGMGVVVALLVAGCGSGATEAKPAMVISAALDKTTSGTARFAGTTALEGEGDRLVVQRYTGEHDFDSKRSRMLMRAPLDPTDPAGDELVIDGITTPAGGYERISGFAPEGKRWVFISPTDIGVTSGDIQSIGSQDPADGLQFLEGVRHARVVGPDEIRGEATTKYSVTIDIDRLLSLVSKGAEKLSPGFSKGLEALRDRVDLTRLPGAAWLDESGRVRRLSYSMPARIPGHTVRVVSTLDYFDFGVPVSVSAPPESETVPFADVVDRMREYLAELDSGAPSRPAA